MSVDVVQALYDRFNARDLEGMADTVTEDFVLEDMALGLRFEGRDGLMQWLDGFLTAMPDSSTEVTRVVDGGEWIATEHTGRGTTERSDQLGGELDVGDAAHSVGAEPQRHVEPISKMCARLSASSTAAPCGPS